MNFNLKHHRELEQEVQRVVNNEKRSIEKGLYKTGKGDREKIVRVVATGVSVIMPNGLTTRNNVLYCTESSVDKFSGADGRNMICCSAARFLEILPDGSRKFEKLKGEK